VKNSSERILTTHTGSLPRSKALTALLVKREQRKALNLNALKAEIERNLDYVVTHQQQCGVDIGNDGETPRVGFSTYITERMNGFGGESSRKPSLDQIKFPAFADFMMRQIGVSDELAKVWNAPQAVGKLEYDPTLAEAKTESAAPVAPLRTVLVTWTMDLRERPLHIERTVNEHKREIVRDLAI
jgi:5-methyltetrahydropteroyltriglutamate--homocysteine methyltransferase